jgi:hypothetical protein
LTQLQLEYTEYSDIIAKYMENKEFSCPECGASNPIGFSFCAKCGKKFSYTCPDCNTEITPDSKYCPICGAELIWSIPSMPAPKKHSHASQGPVRPVQVKIMGAAPLRRIPGKQAQAAKRKFNVVPWIIVFILIIITIVLLLNFDSLFK